jgi:hypothetical protein
MLGLFYIALVREDCPNRQKLIFFMASEHTAAAPDEDARHSNALLTWKINICYCFSNGLNSTKRTSSNYPLKKVLQYLATQDHPKLCVINTFSLRQINELPFCGQTRDRHTVATYKRQGNIPRQNAQWTIKQHTS